MPGRWIKEHITYCMIYYANYPLMEICTKYMVCCQINKAPIQKQLHPCNEQSNEKTTLPLWLHKVWHCFANEQKLQFYCLLTNCRIIFICIQTSQQQLMLCHSQPYTKIKAVTISLQPETCSRKFKVETQVLKKHIHIFCSVWSEFLLQQKIRIFSRATTKKRVSSKTIYLMNAAEQSFQQK